MQRAVDVEGTGVALTRVEASQRRRREPYGAQAELVLCMCFRHRGGEMAEEEQQRIVKRYFRKGGRHAQGDHADYCVSFCPEVDGDESESGGDSSDDASASAGGGATISGATTASLKSKREWSRRRTTRLRKGGEEEHACAQCGSAEPAFSGRHFRRCDRCKAVFYCGKTCQERHWAAGHRDACAPAAQQ